MLLKKVNILDVEHECVLWDQDVLIQNGVIRAVAPNIESDEEQLDCTGGFLTPAYFDMHVHIDTPDMLPLLFVNGVAAVRNMWGRPDHIAARQSEQPGKPIPNIVTGSPIIDGVASLNGNVIIRTPEEARQAVARYVQEGYDFIKTYPRIPRDAFFALMDEACARGVRVGGHGNLFVSTAELITSGYASLEHASCLPQQDEDITLLAKSGIWFVPTLTTLEQMVAFSSGNRRIDDVEHAEYADMGTKQIWADNINRYRREERFRLFRFPELVRRARIFLAHSDHILLGSDTPMPGTVAGFSVHQEFRMLVDLAGLTPAQALRTATANAAQYLGMESRGTVAPGKTADILLLDANPLDDIGNTTAIRWFMKDGVLFDREALDSMLLAIKLHALERGN